MFSMKSNISWANINSLLIIHLYKWEKSQRELVLRSDSRLCDQQLLLKIIRGTYVVPGIEWVSAACKTSIFTPNFSLFSLLKILFLDYYWFKITFYEIEEIKQFIEHLSYMQPIQYWSQDILWSPVLRQE